MSDDRLQPEQVYPKVVHGLPPGAYLTGCLVIATYVVPGESDADDQGPWLTWCCDGVAGRWAHLGMAETVANDCRESLRTKEEDG